MPRFPRPARFAFLAALVAAPAVAQVVEFRHAQDDSPLALDFRPDQAVTAPVESFQATGDNPYQANPQAVTDGKELYAQHCASCHGKDGAGGDGPNLSDQVWDYPRTNSDVGRFEIIYAGYGDAAGEAHAFGRQLDQDAILQLMAYLDALLGG